MVSPMLIVRTRNSTYRLSGTTLTSDNPRYPELEIDLEDHTTMKQPVLGYYWMLKIEPECAKRLGRKSHLVTSTVQSFEEKSDDPADAA